MRRAKVRPLLFEQDYFSYQLPGGAQGRRGNSLYTPADIDAALDTLAGFAG